MNCCRNRYDLLKIYDLYFNTLSNTGYKDRNATLTLFVISFIDDFYKDCELILDDFEKHIICKAMNCLMKDKCLNDVPCVEDHLDEETYLCDF